MIWRSVSLDDYLPFSHSKIKHVSIDFTHQPAQAFLGTNGSGKSSLLRALTPYSPVRTDYGKGGKIVKIIDHNSSVFELTSDFSNTSAPHSFKKDGVELNLSGTSETQKDLIEENFGITKLIDDIMTGDVKICSLARAARKELFSATYPSDLSFVLDYHKQICSQIRAYANQLKLLKNREAMLRASLIDENEREKLIEFREAANRVIDGIDKNLYLLSNEIERFKGNPILREEIEDSTVASGDDEAIISKMRSLEKQIKDCFKLSNYHDLANANDSLLDNLTRLEAEYTSKVISSKERVESLTRDLSAYRDELNQFTECRNNAGSKEDKSRMEDDLRRCEKELSDVERLICPGSSSIQEGVLDKVEFEYIPYLKQWIESIHPSSGRIMSIEELMDLGNQLSTARLHQGFEVTQEISRINSRLVQLNEKLIKLRSNAYPSSCVQVCPLRDAVADNIKATKQQFDELIAHKEELEKDLKEAEQFIRTNEAIYNEQKSLHDKIDKEERNLSSLGISGIALQSESMLNCCNEHSFELVNRLVKACEISRLLIRKQKLVSEIESTKRALAAIAAMKQISLSADIIEKTIHDREEKIDRGVIELDKLESDEIRFSKIAGAMGESASAYRDMLRMKRGIETLLNRRRVLAVIEFNESISSELSNAKHDLSRKLRDIESVIDEQNKTLSILNSEIIPTMNSIEKEKSLFELVAKGLSPTSGLPCIYLVRFINRLISRTNEFIKKVWFYDMELIYLKEEDNLDFTIQVLLRNSTVVKDLSMLSAGQQAIVNFAMTLSIAVERGFADWMPLKMDETDATLSDEHRTRLVELINELIETGTVKQLFLVNHFAIQTGMSKVDSVVLNSEGICIPSESNLHAEIC